MRPNSRFEKHPVLWNTVLVAITVVSCILVLEIFLRLSLDYHIDYYARKGGVANTELHYPYGNIPVNSLGEADSEFDLTSKKLRIGYFGDSVNYGVGAGYPYRFSDLVEQALPEYDHWNVGSESGAGIPLYLPEKVRRFGLKYAVYLLNLNDISPAVSSTDDASTNIVVLKQVVRYSLDFLRDKSYIYNFIRFKAKNAMALWFGFNASGYVAYELWPSKYERFFQLAMQQVNELGRETRRAGAELCIVVLPYEMQISHPAARAYKNLGFKWEDEFLEGKPQSLIKKWLDPELHLHDPISYFAPFESEVGTLFVYNKGDKIDWNHPNREGHKMISESFLSSRDCPFLAGEPSSASVGQ